MEDNRLINKNKPNNKYKDINFDFESFDFLNEDKQFRFLFYDGK